MPKKIDPLNKKQYGAVTAMLTVADVKAAANFYQKALGFTKRGIMNGPDGKPNPTYRCLFPDPPEPGTVPTCAEAGVLGALAGVLGSLMALEAIRVLVGGFGDGDEGLVGRLLMIDTRAMRFETLRYAWDPDNPLSGRGARSKALLPGEV